MIEWLTVTELETRLQLYPPIGLTLRPFFHARTKVAASDWFGRPPELDDEPGLGEVSVWCGLVDSHPFAVVARPRDVGWGFEVRLPCRSDGDAATLASLEQLGLPAWSSPYFDCVPVRDGFGVAQVGGATTIYASPSRADAVACAALLNRVEPQRYAVLPVRTTEPAWVVYGPASGPYVSRLEVTSNERAARELAARWSNDAGVPFRVDAVSGQSQARQ